MSAGFHDLLSIASGSFRGLDGALVVVVVILSVAVVCSL